MNQNKSKQIICSFTFEFEHYFDIQSDNKWMSQNWSSSFYWVIAYLVVIFGGRVWMSYRQPYQLKWALILWNWFQALFSIAGTVRLLPEIIDIMRGQGFEASVCNNSLLTEVQVSHTWVLLFTLSKVSQLGDTVFTVLHKKKLIFLHWYHHITVLLFCWYGLFRQSSVLILNSVVNFGIHSSMYSYYAVRAMSISVPKWIPVLITFSQIIEMIFGFFVEFYAFNRKFNGYECMTPYSVLYWGLVMYFTYLILFSNFFFHSYLKNSRAKHSKNK